MCLDSLSSCNPFIISNIEEFLFDEDGERCTEHMDGIFYRVDYQGIEICAVKANFSNITFSGEYKTHIEIAKSATSLPMRFYNTYSLAMLPKEDV